MSEIELGIWIAVVAGASGVLGAVSGGLFTYITTGKQLEYDRKAERREREIKRFEAAFESLLYVESLYQKVLWSLSVDTRDERPWSLPKREGSESKSRASVSLVVSIYVPHLKESVDELFQLQTQIVIKGSQGLLSESQEERQALFTEMGTMWRACLEMIRKIKDGLADAAQKHFD